MKGHYFFKWLFLTVLSVSVLHFRENSSIGHYRTEQISSGESIGKKHILDFGYCKKLSEARPADFIYFKNTQHARLTNLSNSLNIFVSRHPELGCHRVLAEFNIQNQHFRSRALASDDHSISRS